MGTGKQSSGSVLTVASSFVINGKGYVTGGVNKNFIGPYNTSHLFMYDPVAIHGQQSSLIPEIPIYGAATFAIGTRRIFWNWQR